MYIDRLHVQHLKLLTDFRLGFTGDDGQPRMWTVIIGRNGTAKTSILQAIALAAAGARQVGVLAKPVVGHLVDRRSKAALEIDVVFRFSPQSADERLHPVLGRRLASEERLKSQLSTDAEQAELQKRMRELQKLGVTLPRQPVAREPS